MQVLLNPEQAKGLANFFFDMAKGLILGSLGLALTIPIEVKIAVLMPSIFSLFGLLK